MHDTDPFVSCGTSTKSNKSINVSAKLDKAIERLFLKSAKEGGFNRRSVGSGGSVEINAFDSETALLWQPHDYRLYIDFSKIGFNSKKPGNRVLQNIKSSVARFNPAYTFSAKNYGKEFLYKDFMFCTIEVKKNQICIRNRSHAKQWRLIKRDGIDLVKSRIDEIMARLRDESIQALQVFIRCHGGLSNYSVLNERCEHGIHGDSYLDSVPAELVINDTVFKKVYRHKTEFKDVAAMKTYIANRSVEEISPEIAKAINDLGVGEDRISFVVGLLDRTVGVLSAHVEANKETAVGLKGLVNYVNSQLPKPFDPSIDFMEGNPLRDYTG